MNARFRLRLAKEDFKFSAAHFTLFSARAAETLHGHNYHVELEVEGEELDEFGFLAEFSTLKRSVRALCASLDEKILLPAASTHLRAQESDGHLEVFFADRRYGFPKNEVVWLPVVNITVESLARWCWSELAPAFAELPLSRSRVTIAETAGQAASYEASLTAD